MDSLTQALTMLVTTAIVPAALAGLVWGIIGGALPGISASITMALILPLTYTLDPVSAVVLLASVYIGAEYGGSIPAILIRTPGTNSAAATIIDGYEMKRQGRAGEALGISLWSGIVGSLFGLAMLILMTEPLSRIALAFRPTSYCALGVLGLSIIASLSERSLLKGLAAAVVGMMVATVGTDPISGVSRFTFGLPELLAGVKPILIMIGLFAVSELLRQSGTQSVTATAEAIRVRLPSLPIMRKIGKAQAIGCVVGTVRRPDAGRRRLHRVVLLLQRGQALVALPGGVRQGLGRGRRRARGRQQHGGQHGADPAAQLRHSRARTRPLSCSAASSSMASCRDRACSSRTATSSSAFTPARSSPSSRSSWSASSSCRSACGW